MDEERDEDLDEGPQCYADGTPVRFCTFCDNPLDEFERDTYICDACVDNMEM